MKRRSLSVLLAISLIVGMLSCLSMVNASVEDYTLRAITSEDAGNAAWLDTAMAKNNAIAGLTPTFAVSSPTGYNSAHLGYLTDNNIPGITDNTEADEKIFWNLSKSSYISYDFGSVMKISDILIAGQCPNLLKGGWEGLGEISVYLSTAKDNLISDGNLVAKENLKYGGLMTLNAPRTARYVAIAITSGTNGNGGYARISELGVYVNKGYTKKTITGPTDSTWVKEAMSGYNAIAGLTPTFKVASPTHYSSSSLKYLTDNNTPGITDDTTNDQKIFWATSSSPYIQFDLGSSLKVESLLVTGSYPELIGEWKTKLGKVSVYMSNSEADLISDTNLVAEETFDLGGVLTLDVPTAYQYVAVSFGDSIARVSELGVYVDKGYTKTVIDGADDADYVNSFASKTNVAKDTGYKLYSSPADMASGTSIATVADKANTMMDGIIPGVNGQSDVTDNDSIKGHWSMAYYLLIDFGGLADVESILMAGPYLSAKEKEALGTVTVWLGNDKATLTTEPLATYTESVTAGVVITPDTPVSARYAAVKVQKAAGNWSRFTELGIYGELTYYTAMSSVGEVTMRVSSLSDNDHLFFENTLGGFTITETAAPSTVRRYTEDNWLELDEDTVFTVQLIDKSGKPIPETGDDDAALNGREVAFSFPSTKTYVQTMAVLEGNTLRRLYNSFPDKQTRRINAGVLEYPLLDEWTDDDGTTHPVYHHREKVVLSGTQFHFAYLRLRDAESIYRINNMPVNDSLLEFIGDDASNP